MARKKQSTGKLNLEDMERGSEEIASKLGDAFDVLVEKEYGHLTAPQSIITPFGIAPLDALLGGGVTSSDPVMFSSTPETGKSTLAFQFSSVFQNVYKNSVIVYLDIEGSGGQDSSQYRVSRIESFGLDVSRFKYQNIVMNVEQVFALIETLVDMKNTFEEKVQQEFFVLIVWDSIAATPGSKTEAAENHDKIIGHKARQLSFCLDKYTPKIKFNRVTFICIDQIRANIKIDGPYAQTEKSVGSFKDYKAASNIFSLQHKLQQWLFLSKKKVITLGDGMGIDGWYVDITTEKNKLAPSQHAITCVFDKKTGLHKFWSEYFFLSDFMPSEKKIYGKTPSATMLSIKKAGSYVKLVVKDPETKKKMYESDSFYRKDAETKYNEDEIFRGWFDYAVQTSIHERITQGIFKCDMNQLEEKVEANYDDQELDNIASDVLAPDVNSMAQEIDSETVIPDNQQIDPTAYDASQVNYDGIQQPETQGLDTPDQLGPEHFTKDPQGAGYKSAFDEN